MSDPRSVVDWADAQRALRDRSRCRASSRCSDRSATGSSPAPVPGLRHPPRGSCRAVALVGVALVATVVERSAILTSVTLVVGFLLIIRWFWHGADKGRRVAVSRPICRAAACPPSSSPSARTPWSTTPPSVRRTRVRRPHARRGARPRGRRHDRVADVAAVRRHDQRRRPPGLATRRAHERLEMADADTLAGPCVRAGGRFGQLEADHCGHPVVLESHQAGSVVEGHRGRVSAGFPARTGAGPAWPRRARPRTASRGPCRAAWPGRRRRGRAGPSGRAGRRPPPRR